MSARILILGLSLIVSLDLAAAEGTTVVSASWIEHFETPAELATRVDAIAVARVLAVRPGRVAYSDNGEDALPFEEVEFEVTTGVKGLLDLERFTLERVGGVDGQGNTVVMAADGGPFNIGGSYLLFLRKASELNVLYQVNDQGRLSLSGDRLEAGPDGDGVAMFFHGRTPEDAVKLIREYLKPAVKGRRAGKWQADRK